MAHSGLHPRSGRVSAPPMRETETRKLGGLHAPWRGAAMRQLASGAGIAGWDEVRSPPLLFRVCVPGMENASLHAGGTANPHMPHRVIRCAPFSCGMWGLGWCTDGFDLKEFALARGSLVFLADMLGLAPPSLPFLAAHA